MPLWQRVSASKAGQLQKGKTACLEGMGVYSSLTDDAAEGILLHRESNEASRSNEADLGWAMRDHTNESEP